jgi:5-hydroxyisourate hydrolase
MTRPSSPITSHVLDTALGGPARNLAVRLEVLDDADAWQTLAVRATGDDGRVGDLLPPTSLRAGIYRLLFATGAYFADSGRSTFYPRVEVIFEVTEAAVAAGEHFHVPLLVSPFGYTTYRGS